MIRPTPAVGMALVVSTGRREYNENSGKLVSAMPGRTNPHNPFSMVYRSDGSDKMAVWLVSDSDSIGYHFSFLSISRICLAGTPPTTVLAATSFVTTDPAAIMALSPTVTPRRMVELEPTHTFLPNRIGAGYIAPRSSGAVP